MDPIPVLPIPGADAGQKELITIGLVAVVVGFVFRSWIASSTNIPVLGPYLAKAYTAGTSVVNLS